MGLNSLVTTEGESIYKGQILTTGALNIKNYQSIVGDLETMKYMLREVNSVYGAQGQTINDKHVEVIIKQLFSKVFIFDAGDSSFVPGTHAKYEEVIKINSGLVAAGKKPCVYTRLVL